VAGNKYEQEQSETAYLRQGESGPHPDSGSGSGEFLVPTYICGEIFMKIRSLGPEI